MLLLTEKSFWPQNLKSVASTHLYPLPDPFLDAILFPPPLRYIVSPISRDVSLLLIPTPWGTPYSMHLPLVHSLAIPIRCPEDPHCPCCRSPVCVLMWRLRSKASWKPLPQQWHTWRRAGLWHLRCRVSMRCSGKALGQSGQPSVPGALGAEVRVPCEDCQRGAGVSRASWILPRLCYSTNKS